MLDAVALFAVLQTLRQPLTATVLTPPSVSVPASVLVNGDGSSSKSNVPMPVFVNRQRGEVAPVASAMILPVNETTVTPVMTLPLELPLLVVTSSSRDPRLELSGVLGGMEP